MQVEDETKKRGAEESAEEPAAKKMKDESGNAVEKSSSSALTPEKLATIKKQVEYYFSTDNLRYDKFFQEKMREDPENFLDIKHLLGCKKIQVLEASQADILEAIKDSSLKTKVVGESAFVKRDEELPKLEERQGKFPQKNMSKSVHDGGCLFYVRNIPEEFNWAQVKDVISKKLPEGGKVDFASNVTDNNSCLVLMKPFDNDVEFVEALELELGGGKLKVELAYGDLFAKAAKLLPKHIQSKRERRGRERAKARQRPILIAQQKMPNVNTLRGRLKEIVGARKDGTALVQDSPDYNLVKAVLEYHPRALEKMAGLTGLKVDVAEKGDSRCIWIMKGDGKPEDISILKCLQEIEARPPYVEMPKVGAVAKKEEASPEKKTEEKKEGAEEKKEVAEEKKEVAEEKKAEA